MLLHIPASAPSRYVHLTHATIDDAGVVGVGVLARGGGIIGHVIDAIAPTHDAAGLLAALVAEDARLSEPLTEAQLAALEKEPWCGVRP